MLLVGDCNSTDKAGTIEAVCQQYIGRAQTHNLLRKVGPKIAGGYLHVVKSKSALNLCGTVSVEGQICIGGIAASGHSEKKTIAPCPGY